MFALFKVIYPTYTTNETRNFVLTAQNQENKTPLLTVILPTYNIEQYLRQCLDSVVNQTYKNLEIIIIDDNSSDSTPDIIKEYASNDERSKPVFHTKNHGPGNTRNEGLGIATGDYVTFMDHDDWQELDKYEKMMAKVTEHDADIVFCNAQEYDETRNKMNRFYFTLPKKSVAPDKLEVIKSWEDRGRLLRCLVPPWAKIVRMELVREHKVRFSEGGNRFDDLLFHYHACYFAQRVYFIDEILYTHRIFPASISGRAKTDGDMYFDLFKTWEDLSAVCHEQGIPPKKMFALYLKPLSALTHHANNWRAFGRKANAIAEGLNMTIEDIPPSQRRAYKKLRRQGCFWHIYYKSKFALRSYYKAAGRILGIER